MTSLEQKYRFQQVEAMITKFGSSEVRNYLSTKCRNTVQILLQIVIITFLIIQCNLEQYVSLLLQQLHIVKEHLLLSREKLCGGLCLIEPVLLTMKSFLTDPIWYGAPPANTIISVDDNQEFHRLWSALQFVFCMPARSQHEYTIE